MPVTAYSRGLISPPSYPNILLSVVGYIVIPASAEQQLCQLPNRATVLCLFVSASCGNGEHPVLAPDVQPKIWGDANFILR